MFLVYISLYYTVETYFLPPSVVCTSASVVCVSLTGQEGKLYENLENSKKLLLAPLNRT